MPLGKQGRSARNPELTAPELLVLRYASHGLRPSEIAVATCKSVHTVNDQLYMARLKLRAKSRAEACSEAIRKGLIP